MTPDNMPTDQLDSFALSVLQQIGSTATTGVCVWVRACVRVCVRA